MKHHAGSSAKDFRYETRLAQGQSAGGPSGASGSSRIRRPFHKPGRFDSASRAHQSAATRNGACNLAGEATSANSRFHLISVLPLIHPTGEEGLVLVV